MPRLDMEMVVEEEAAAAATGVQCNRYAVLENPSTKQRQLIWTLSHALINNTL